MVALIAVVSVLVIGVLVVDVFAGFDAAQQEIGTPPGPLPPTPQLTPSVGCRPLGRQTFFLSARTTEPS